MEMGLVLREAEVRWKELRVKMILLRWAQLEEYRLALMAVGQPMLLRRRFHKEARCKVWISSTSSPPHLLKIQIVKSFQLKVVAKGHQKSLTTVEIANNYLNKTIILSAVLNKVSANNKPQRKCEELAHKKLLAKEKIRSPTTKNRQITATTIYNYLSSLSKKESNQPKFRVKETQADFETKTPKINTKYISKTMTSKTVDSKITINKIK